MKKVNLLKSIGVLLVTIFTFVSCGKSKVLGTWNFESERETVSYTFIDDGTVESVSTDTKHLGTYKYEKDVVTMSFTKEAAISDSGAVGEYEALDKEYVEYGIIDNDEIFIGRNRLSLPDKNTVEGTYVFPVATFGNSELTTTFTLTPYSDDDEKKEGSLGKAHLEEIVNSASGSYTSEYNGDYTRKTVNNRDVLSLFVVGEDYGLMMKYDGNIKNGFWYTFGKTLKKQK